MELRRWTNPHQPQTLYLATILLYIRAVLGLVLRGTTFALYWNPLVNLLAAAAMVAGGLGIANEQKWGYRLAVAVTAIGLWPFVAWAVWGGPLGWQVTDYVLLALFPVAQFILLVHPMSREHQRIWFR
jgi:hypothetical protein